MHKITHWADELGIFDDTMDQYAFLIELAKKPTTLPGELRTEDKLVNGCISKIWVDVGEIDGRTRVYYDSDALITKGVTHVICDCFDDLPIDQAKQITKSQFTQIGLEGILSSNRRNGLSCLIETLQIKIASL